MTKFTLSIFCGLLLFALGCTTEDHVLPPIQLKDAVYAMASSINPDEGFLERDFLNTFDWTINGEENVVRVFLNFDLSQIASTSSVKSAKLSLYYAPDSDHWDQGHQGDNGIVIQRVTDSWMASNLSWNNQPTGTTVNQILIPAAQSPTQDYLNMDITALVNDMLKTGENNGLLIKLQVEELYKINFWASSDYKDANRHPKLDITFN